MTCTRQRQLGRCEVTDLSQDASQRRDVELTNAHGHGEQYRTAVQKGPHACKEVKNTTRFYGRHKRQAPKRTQPRGFVVRAHEQKKKRA
ncbi:unnamed protein product [Macrosiphum euphorbiae]|uniref:Uncharacterized protein n=1 Tax=Macrosiphum euphorbiae TaxID=13131 RepID=A0AAV0XMK7_9HEMI|nr:unnamed protein product [Macrosiphum euphorbiae]